MLLQRPLSSPLPPPLTKPHKPIFLPSPPLPLKSPISSISSSQSPYQSPIPKTAIQRISEKLRNLGYIEKDSNFDEFSPNSSSPGEIFIPSPANLPIRRVGYTVDSSWSSPESPVPVPGSGPGFSRFRELRKAAGTTVTATTKAELVVPAGELRRLRRLGIGLDRKLRLKIGKAGVTEGIVNSVHERWRRSELVKIQCEDLCRINMKRTHDVLEKKTGGLVIWRSGSIIILYRGADYKYPYFTHTEPNSESESTSDSEIINNEEGADFLDSSASLASTHRQLVHGVGAPDKVRFQMPGEVELGEEVDRLLDGLGPRFVDWWDPGPPPVDADLLPAIVNGYRRPFRLLPFGLQPKLTDREMTILRRLSRPLPCHFALGRNRNLQGLAQSMVKLWEKCEIAKIAVKRGVRNTNSELMAEELKRLTGGTILSRDKDFIVFYRGKDFLPIAVSSAIEKRRKLERRSQTSEFNVTQSQRMEVNSEYQSSIDTMNSEIAEETGSSCSAVKLEAKLASALRKKEKAEKVLQELDQSMEPSKSELDKEGITEEERYMLRKIGLRMKPFLLMGRRGVFDGTVENMHLHWKYRELVKIISKDKSVDNVQRDALELESSSGGILVAIERVSKGFAIIIYRGKNYSRPGILRPQNLLNKKEALRRSLEAQRRQSLKLHVLKLSEDIDKIRHQMASSDIEFESSAAVSKTSKDRFFEEENATLEGNTDNDTVDMEDLSDVEDPTDQNHPAVMSDEPMVPEAEMRKSSVVKVSHTVNVLSNKERLILRKQALQMKKRPIFAVGRSNAVAGVAKAIVAHFRKYPLAIVNVKGRAKGTSVQELVFALEQATGGLMVSREPSKIILYRGWQEQRQSRAREEKGGMREDEKEDVSQQLLAAISLECGDLS